MPFGAWQPCKLTGSGLPDLAADETEYAKASNVDLREGSSKPADYKGGEAYITSHRVIWIDKARQRPLALNLALVKRQEHEDNWFSSDKITYTLAAAAPDGGRKYVLAFKGDSKSDNKFEKGGAMALERQKWLDAARAKQRQEDEQQANRALMKNRGGGIGYLMEKNKRDQNRQKAVGQEAFGGDLSSLMEKAKDIVRLTERFADAKKAEKRRSRSASGGGGGGGKEADGGDDDDDLNELMSTMGIANPVTKEASGASYHKDLARQMADFLNTDRLLKNPRGGGMMPITDIYCLYNKNRGTKLISPDDCYQACALMAGLRLGMSLKKFATGVVVVQLDGASEEATTKRLAALARERYGDGTSPHAGGIAATDVLGKLGGSLPVAKAQLRAAEARGALCRDESLEDGVVFYPNLFAEVKLDDEEA